MRCARARSRERGGPRRGPADGDFDVVERSGWSTVDDRADRNERYPVRMMRRFASRESDLEARDGRREGRRTGNISWFAERADDIFRTPAGAGRSVFARNDNFERPRAPVKMSNLPLATADIGNAYTFRINASSKPIGREHPSTRVGNNCARPKRSPKPRRGGDHDEDVERADSCQPRASCGRSRLPEAHVLVSSGPGTNESPKRSSISAAVSSTTRMGRGGDCDREDIGNRPAVHDGCRRRGGPVGRGANGCARPRSCFAAEMRWAPGHRAASDHAGALVTTARIAIARTAATHVRGEGLENRLRNRTHRTDARRGCLPRGAHVAVRHEHVTGSGDVRQRCYC